MKSLSMSIGTLSFVETGIDDVGACLGEHHRMAVGSGVRHLLRADDVRAAALVLDHDLLTPFLRQPGADRARDDVGHAAGGGGDDDSVIGVSGADSDMRLCEIRPAIDSVSPRSLCVVVRKSLSLEIACRHRRVAAWATPLPCPE